MVETSVIGCHHTTGNRARSFSVVSTWAGVVI